MDLITGFYDAERVYTTLPTSASTAEREAARDKWISFLDEEFEITQSPDLPWGGVYKGRDQFQVWMGKVDKLVSKIDVETEQMLSSSDGTMVITYLTVHWTARKTGEDFDRPMTQVWTIDQEKHTITSIRPFYWDVKSFKEKLGVSA